MATEQHEVNKSERSGESGVLYVCATPIGNLEDLTYRVVRILGQVDLIAAEDTRNSRKLLSHLDIHTPMTSYHEHNRYDKAKFLVQELLAGKNIALISDAGMPAISDPGEVLVRMCHEAGISVTALPGACACIDALAVSGMSSRRFCFEGFLPPDKKERAALLQRLGTEERTVIFYEAPHHLKKTLEQLCSAVGPDRELALCRELTKKHEEIIRSTVGGCIELYENEDPRGEYVLILGGQDPEEIAAKKRESYDKLSFGEHLSLYLSRGMEKKEAMKAVATDRGIGKREVYAALEAEKAGHEE